MLALQFDEYGGPEVLHVGDAPEPHAGAGQVRVAVRAASVNPYDAKLRAGSMAEVVPLAFPAIPGVDAAGVVDEVGEGVEGVSVGDEVFGLGSQTSAEYAVLDLVARKPAGTSFADAAALGIVVEAAARALGLLDLSAGDTLLVDGAAGGTGTAMTQLAVARGLRVIGTASPHNHDYLRGLGATPTTYGKGLVERVAALAPMVNGAADLVGRGSVPDLIAITGDPRAVVTLADFTAYALGVHVADGSEGQARHSLAEAADLIEQGRFTMPVERVLPLAEGAEAHRLSATGHVRGKVVLTVP